jgi:hypothetical protein
MVSVYSDSRSRRFRRKRYENFILKRQICRFALRKPTVSQSAIRIVETELPKAGEVSPTVTVALQLRTRVYRLQEIQPFQAVLFMRFICVRLSGAFALAHAGAVCISRWPPLEPAGMALRNLQPLLIRLRGGGST